MRPSFIFILYLSSLITYSQRLTQEGESFKIEYLNEEIWQQGLEIGSKFDLNGLVDINGNSLTDIEFTDKIVVVKFWFIGCRGCKQEEEYIKQVTQHFSDQPNILFVSISMSSQSKIVKYYEKNGDFGYRTVSMKRKDIEDKYNVRTSPTHWFFKNGELVDKIIGPIYSPAAKDWMIKFISELKV